MNGKFKWYKKDKGYGFVIGEDGKEYFTHFSALPKNQQDIKESDDVKVVFELKDTERGKQVSKLTFEK